MKPAVPILHHMKVMLRRFGLLLVLAVLAGCGGSASTEQAAGAQQGDTATWEVNPASPPSEKARSIAVMVSRLGCAGGVTGKVLAPVVREEGQQVIVTYQVEALPREEGADYTCLGNAPVESSLLLAAELGTRSLLDGACLEGQAGSTGPCAAGASRWPAP